MNICGDGHDEIVYIGDNWSNCPLCELKEELEGKLQTATEELEEAKEKIETLEYDALEEKPE